jgi:uncharacterized protein (DUF427 family)
MDTVKIPGPDHPIHMAISPRRVVARYQGHLIAESTDALVVKEASYRPVFYFPREDVAMDFLGATAHDTYCPYKGHASYFTIDRDAVISENAVWSYVTPHPGMEALAGRLAFYPNVVEIEELEETHVDAVIQHTDSGAGASQKEHWPATAKN